MKNNLLFIGFVFMLLLSCKQHNINKLLDDASHYYVEGEYGKAVEIYSSILVQDPDNQLVLFNSALAFNKAGNNEKAIATLSYLIDLVGDHDDAHYQRAMFYYQAANYVESIKDFDHVSLSADFDINEINFYRGMCYYSLKMMVQALQNLERVTYYSTYKTDADYWSGLIYEYLGAWGNAISKYESILREGNYQPAYYYRMAFCYENLHQEYEAKQYYSSALQIDSNYTLAYLRRAYLLFKERQYALAYNDYLNVIESDSLHLPLAIKGSIASNLMLGNIIQAGEYIDQFESLTPGDKFVLHLRNFMNTYSVENEKSNIELFELLNQELKSAL